MNQRHKALMAGILGNMVEYYDYTLYGLLASEISQHFFASGTKAVELLQAFAVFALGSLSKPLGALIFSRIGDHYGRKPALKWNMLGIAIPTTLIGVIPTYEAWGIMAPLILIICRLLQGFFVGGEADGVRIYIMEHVGPKRYCFADGLVGFTSYSGIYLASYLSGLVLTPMLPEGAWRWLFLLGGIFGGCVFLLRRNLTETLEYTQKKPRHGALLPFSKMLSKNWRILLAIVLLTGSGGAVYPFLIIFMNSYVSDVLGLLSPATAALYTSYALLAYAVSAPIGGLIADYLSKGQIVFWGKVILLMITAMLAHALVEKALSPHLFVAIGLVQGLFSAPIYPLLLERIGVHERYRTLSMGHTLGSLLLANTTPFICVFLWNWSGNVLMPVFYFMGLIALTWVGLLVLRSERQQSHV